jgi:hypothetical protein
MQNFLTPYRSIFILCLLFRPIPAAIHQIKACQCNLNYNKIDSLIADETKNGTSEIVMKEKIKIGNEKVENEMEKDSCNYNKHGPICESVWITHLREFIH